MGGERDSPTVPGPGRLLVAVLIAAGVWLPGCHQAGDANGDESAFERPNIILVTIDTTRADHLGCYGYDVAETSPHMDELARTGARFDLAVAQSATTPVCCASLLTGLYPYRHGLRSMHGRSMNRLRDGVPMIQEELVRLGYRAAAFVSAFPAGSNYGFARGFELFDEQFLEQGRRPTITPEGLVFTGRSQRTAAETTGRFLPWLREHAEGPFFAWLHYFDPHDPDLMPPEELYTRFLRSSPNEDREEFLRSVYDAEIFYVDRHVGQIVARLDELEIRDRTVVIVTSDHGEGLGDHDWWAHGILYQEQIRAPLIFNGPGIPPRSIVSNLVEHVDLYPTILELAGSAPTGRDLDGRSLMPFFRGAAAHEGSPAAYSESHNIQAFGETEEQRARGEWYALIRDGFKLIHLPRDPAADQLYDLEADPHELDNRIAQDPETARAMREELRARGAIDGETPEPATLSPAEREHLRALGYIE